jgi:hypothetical protein
MVKTDTLSSAQMSNVILHFYPSLRHLFRSVKHFLHLSQFFFRRKNSLNESNSSLSMEYKIARVVLFTTTFILHLPTPQSQHWLSYGLEDPKVAAPKEQDIFLLSKSSKPALGPNQPNTQWLPGFFSWKKQPERAVDQFPPSSAKVKKELRCVYTRVIQ